MADQKITQLTALASAASTDVLPIVDVANTETKKITKADLLNGLQAELVSGTNIKTINSESLLGSGDITISGGAAAGTDGQIQFNSSSAFGADSNLFWDNTNKRLGVGTNAPTTALDILPPTQTATATQFDCMRVGYSNSTIGVTNKSALQVQVATTGTARYSTTLRLSGGSDTSQAYLKGFDSNTFGVMLNRAQSNLGLFSDNGIKLGATAFAGSDSAALAMVHIKGSGSTSATTSLLVQNSSGTELFKVQDDGRTSIGQQSSVYPNIGLSGIYGGLFLNAGGQIALRSGGADIMSLTASLNVGIGTTSPNTSAKLDISSTTQGFLPPRMTTTQKNAISSPAAGLQVYDSTTNRAAVYSTAWENVITETNGSPNSVYKLWSGSAAQYAALTPDSSTLYFVI